jgi:hypothetical protein
MSLNFIKFMSIDPLNVERIAEAIDLLPVKEQQNIKNHMLKNSKLGRFSLAREVNPENEFGDELQIDIPTENVRLIELNKMNSVFLTTSSETASYVKSNNPDLYVILNLS